MEHFTSAKGSVHILGAAFECLLPELLQACWNPLCVAAHDGISTQVASSSRFFVILCATALFMDYLNALIFASNGGSLPYWLSVIIKSLLVLCASCLNLGGAGFVGTHPSGNPLAGLPPIGVHSASGYSHHWNEIPSSACFQFWP